jgi:hypothetical protein
MAANLAALAEVVLKITMVIDRDPSWLAQPFAQINGRLEFVIHFSDLPSTLLWMAD